jgi:outer membrane protein OmpA-like peptidoglycan-associated protein
MLPQKQKRTGAAAIIGVAIGVLLASPMTTALAASLPDYPCESSAVEARYISPEDLGRLRTLRQQATPSAPFLDLANDDIPLIDEVLRVGPSAGFYAARLLRDLAILDAFERQIQCDPKQHCPKPEIIAGFSPDNMISTDGPGTWQTLIRNWKEFRDRDAARGRACLEVSRTRPTYEILVIAENDPKPPPVARGKDGHPIPHGPGRPDDSSASDAPKSSTETGLPPELVGLAPAEVRFCKARSDDASDKSEVSNEQIRRLRDDYGKGDRTILSDMNVKYREPLEEALRVGPKAGYFAHRALRNLVIIKEVQRQITCPPGEVCSLTEDIRVLKRNNSWPETLAVWKSVRDTDLQRALACMKFSKTLPSFELDTAVVASTNIPKNDDDVTCKIETTRDSAIVHFAKNKAIITGIELSKMTEVVALLKACPGLGTFVAGYTDRDGGRQFNARLSRARAAAVRTHLVLSGVRSEQIEIRGYGVARRRSTRVTREMKAQDRRAEIRIRKIVGGKIRRR